MTCDITCIQLYQTGNRVVVAKVNQDERKKCDSMWGQVKEFDRSNIINCLPPYQTG